MSAFDLLASDNQRIDKNESRKARFDLLSKQAAVLLAFVVPISPVLTNITLLGLVFFWILSGNLQPKLKRIWSHPVARAALLFYGVFVFGSFYSEAPIRDITQQLNKMSKLFCIPFLLLIMSEKKWRLAVIWAFLAAMILTLVLSLLKVYAGLSIIPTQYTTACVFRDHIHTNLMMAFASFVVGHYWLSSNKPRMRLGLFLLLIGLIFYVLFMSEGRSGYIIFAALWILLCLQRLKWKGLSLGFLGLVLLFGFALINPTRFQMRALDAIKNIEQYQVGDVNSSLGARLHYLVQTWDLSKQRLWLGRGTGSFKQVYHKHATSNELAFTQNPHNEYLNIFLQLGVLGLAAFFGFFWTILKNSFYLPSPEKWLAQGMLAAMIIGCIANSWLMDFTPGYFFVTLIAVSFGALNLQGSSWIDKHLLKFLSL